MTQETRRGLRTGLRGGVALLTAAVLVSCSNATQPATERAPSTLSESGSAAKTSTSPSTVPSPTPSRAARSTRPRKPGDPATPATTSGPLSRSSFPRPRTLGARWSYAVDAGDAEKGYRGNGTPALERDTAEIRWASVPMGCPRPHRLPRPTHALEVDYTRGRAKVVAIRARFTGPGEATEFFDRRAATIARCQGRSGGAAIGTLVDMVSRPARGVLLSDRTPRSDPWTELAVLDGATVVLLAAPGRVDDPPLNLRDVGSLVAAFRG